MRKIMVAFFFDGCKTSYKNSCQRQDARFRCNAFPSGFAISKRYLLTYPDGSKRHIKRAERDTLLLSKQAKLTSSGTYLWTGQVRTFHSFAELGKLQTTAPSQLKHFLPGFFIFECKQKRIREYLESPESLELRINHGHH